MNSKELTPEKAAKIMSGSLDRHMANRSTAAEDRAYRERIHNQVNERIAQLEHEEAMEAERKKPLSRGNVDMPEEFWVAARETFTRGEDPQRFLTDVKTLEECLLPYIATEPVFSDVMDTPMIVHALITAIKPDMNPPFYLATVRVYVFLWAFVLTAAAYQRLEKGDIPATHEDDVIAKMEDLRVEARNADEIAADMEDLTIVNENDGVKVSSEVEVSGKVAMGVPSSKIDVAALLLDGDGTFTGGLPSELHSCRHYMHDELVRVVPTLPEMVPALRDVSSAILDITMPGPLAAKADASAVAAALATVTRGGSAKRKRESDSDSDSDAGDDENRKFGLTDAGVRVQTQGFTREGAWRWRKDLTTEEERDGARTAFRNAASGYLFGVMSAFVRYLQVSQLVSEDLNPEQLLSPAYASTLEGLRTELPEDASEEDTAKRRRLGEAIDQDMLHAMQDKYGINAALNYTRVCSIASTDAQAMTAEARERTAADTLNAAMNRTVDKAVDTIMMPWIVSNEVHLAAHKTNGVADME